MKEILILSNITTLCIVIRCIYTHKKLNKYIDQKNQKINTLVHQLTIDKPISKLSKEIYKRRLESGLYKKNVH